MRSDAKASSVGSTMHRAGRLGVLSLGAALLALLLVASSAFASKQVINYAGGSSGSGVKGGEFSEPRDVAVNTTGAGPANAGDFYVIEERNNRVQRFDADGNFISAWGSNVVTAPVTEVQKLTVSATAGTYKLSFEGATTSDIAFDAGAGSVGDALRELPTMGASGLFSVEVSGSGPFMISFDGEFSSSSLRATDVPQIGVDTSSLTGSASVETTTQGSGQYEVCAVAANCREGAGTGGANVGSNAKNGSLNRPSSIGIDGDSGNVYVADRNNRRINEYTGDGTFIRSFGWGVDTSTPGEGYEVCSAADRCRYGVAGSGVGQIGRNQFVTVGIAISPPDGNPATGTIFLADPENRRLDTFGLDGTGPSSIGSSAQFEENQPRKVAVDSRGIVHASDSANGGEIERYDSEDANGSGVGFLAPIAMPPLLEGPEGDATKGLAVDPDSDGAGPERDVLYVLRGSWSSGAVVQQFGPVNDPGLTAPPTASDDTHGAEAGFRSFDVLGLGFDEASGHIFVSASGNVSGTNEANRVYILGEAPAPAATLDPVTIHDAHSATFTGTVDPNGALTGYRFEYVDDAEFQANGFANAKQVPLADKRVGDGEDPVAVQQETPDNLVAGTTYHVRLVAKQAFTATQATTGPVVFTTNDSAPTIEGIAATISTDEAALRGTIEPENEEVTNYHFEWGPTQSYGNTTPAASLPTGKDPVAVPAAVISGLTPGATYHYRLVATNATGTTQGADQTFATFATLPPLGPERAYELVSQYPTGGVPIIPNFSNVSVSENGDRVHFGDALQPLPGSTVPPPPDHLHNGENSWRYGSVRGADGWHVEEYGLAQTLAGAKSGAGVSADGTKYLFSTSSGPDAAPRLDSDDQNHAGGFGDVEVDVYERQPDGSLVWISRDPRIPAGTPQLDPGNATPSGFLGMAQMSVDGSTVVFRSERQLDDADTTPGVPPSSAPGRIYKWTDGRLSFIGIRPDGSVPSRGSELGSGGLGIEGILQDTVSRDGTRVLFGAQRTDGGNNSFDGRTLFIQTDGEPTVEAVKETGVPALPPGQPFATIYRGAAADLSRAFFTANSRLTPDSGASATSGGPNGEDGDHDLYVYDLDANKVRDLTPRLDGFEDPDVDPATADRGRALGLVANSENGRRIYFVADAQYDVAPSPEGKLPSPEGRNLYLAELDGIDDPIKLRFVAALGVNDGPVWQSRLSFVEEKASDASPDASVLGFGSSMPLTGQALGGTEQLFVYDAEADTLECASCPSDGSLPIGDVNMRLALGGGQAWQSPSAVRRWVSTDGRVFFHTASQLLDGDVNLVDDVYEYRAGQLRLVSSGTDTDPSRLEDISRDGGTVIINTSDTLVPYDEEPGIPKLYAARIGGGFPFAPKPTVCDLGAGACESAGTGAPQQPGAGSAAFEGQGDPKPKKAGRRCPKGKRKVRRAGKVHCAPSRSHKHKQDAKSDRRASR